MLDGATGTWLQDNGLPAGISPELWVLENAKTLQELQYAYLQAGSNIIYAFTFGANRIKLAGSDGTWGNTREINTQLAAISCAVRDRFMRDNPEEVVLVAGDLAPTGKFLAPAGDLSFIELIAIYQEQVDGLLQAGVDLFVIETMMDLAQVRAAILAIRQRTDLPIIATVTLEENSRTLAGNGLTECLLALASMGISAFGINCSHGPEKMKYWLEPLLPISPLPLIAKPNAGLPELQDGKTVFSMSADEFSRHMQALAEMGINVLGGCCGTGPEYIAGLKKAVGETEKTITRPAALPAAISSSRKTWYVDNNLLPEIPAVEFSAAGKLVEAVLNADLADYPAIIIDIPDPAPALGFAEESALCAAMQELQLYVDQPLIFRGETQLIHSLVDWYHGRAGIISQTQKTEKGLSLI